MQEYDVALKLLLRGSAKLTMRELTGTAVESWIDVELPKVVQNTRVDLLGETADKGLVHLELQSGHDPNMPLRMAEYCLGVFRLFERFPRQVLLYVGEAPLRMASEAFHADQSPRTPCRVNCPSLREASEVEGLGPRAVAVRPEAYVFHRRGRICLTNLFSLSFANRNHATFSDVSELRIPAGGSNGSSPVGRCRTSSGSSQQRRVRWPDRPRTM